MLFTGDELILALVSLVRATRPAMLRQEADGFTVDFEAIARSKTPGKADQLLLKMGAAMQNDGPAENAAKPISLDLDANEARQIADALERLEGLQAWPKDVMEMSRAMRNRLNRET
jgi:cell division septation protein DedD